MRFLYFKLLIVINLSIFLQLGAEEAVFLEEMPFLICGLEQQDRCDTLAESITRGDSIPKEHIEDVDDTYLEGYIQALLHANYYEFNVIVVVEDKKVYLYNLPKNRQIANSIVSFVADIPGIESVEVVHDVSKEELSILKKREGDPRIKGTWFPQTTVLYPPMLANPRTTNYSVRYQVGDQIVGDHVIAVSLGDEFPIFRWHSIWKWQGDLQIGIQAGIWSLFKMWVDNGTDEYSELFNTDYLVGIPLTYAFDNLAFRFRVYHISSHLGDEFLVYHPDVVRVNPSMEAVDFFTSYQVNDAIRLYIGPGWVFHSDKTYPLNPQLYIEYGGEARFWGSKFYYHQLYGTAFFAAYFRNWGAMNYRLDGTGMFGYEWSKLQGVGRKMRIFVMYHNGYGEGQFFKDHTSYYAGGLSWGF